MMKKYGHAHPFVPSVPSQLLLKPFKLRNDSHPQMDAAHKLNKGLALCIYTSKKWNFQLSLTFDYNAATIARDIYK